MQSKTIEKWVEQGENLKKPYIFFQGYCLDLTDFIKIHPGGKKVIQQHLYTDMTYSLYNVFPHNKMSAPRILQEYRIGRIAIDRQNKRKQNGSILKKRQSQIKEHSIQKKKVKFPTQIQRITSQKYNEELEMSKKLNAKNENTKSSLSNNVNRDRKSISKQKSSSKRKSMDPGYLQMLKQSTNKNKYNLDEKQLEKSDTHIQYFYYKQQKQNKWQNNLKSSTNISIKYNIGKSFGTLSSLIEQQQQLAIKIPVMNIKLNKIW